MQSYIANISVFKVLATFAVGQKRHTIRHINTVCPWMDFAGSSSFTSAAQKFGKEISINQMD